jgi:hypothetical protein
MKFLPCVLLVAASLSPLIAEESCPPIGWSRGYFSGLAAQPCRENLDHKPVTILSPDQKRLLLVKKEEVFEKAVDGGSPEKLFAYTPGEEFLWSPDSSVVLVSFCFGAAGLCGVGSSVDAEGTPTIAEIVRKDFASRHADQECYTNVNVGALTWLDNTDKIVVVAEVPPSPPCVGHNEGYFDSMVVSLSERKVLTRSNMQETIHRWHSILGTGLLSDIKLVREDAKGTQK